MAAIDATGQRLPSARPIDRRWDHSRGIIFANAGRLAGRDFTWSSCDGFPFCLTTTAKRSYAFRPLSSGNKTSDKSSAHADTSYKGTGFTTSPEESAKLKVEKKNLEERVRDLSQQLQTRNEELDSQREETSEAKRDADTAYKKLKHEKSQYERTLQEQRAKSEVILQEQRANAKREIENLKKKSDPQLKENTRILDDVRDEGRQQGETVTRNWYEKKLGELEVRHKQQLSHEAQNSVLVKRLRRELQAVQGERDTVEIQLKELEANFDTAQGLNQDLKRQLQSRRERAQSDRNSYAAYRGIFNDMVTQVYTLCSLLRRVREPFAKESLLWKASAKEFETSKTLFLFRKVKAYDELKRSINQFLSLKADSADTTAQSLVTWGDKLIEDISPLKAASHASRMLTRYHHHQIDHSSFARMDLAYMISNVEPFRERRDACKAQMQTIDSELEQARLATDDAQIAVLQEQRKKLKEDRTFWSLVLCIFEALRQIKSYEALLNDTPIEKAVYFRTLAASERFETAAKAFYEATENGMSVQAPSVKDLTRHRTLWKEQEAVVHKEFEVLNVAVRKHVLLEHELGVLSDQEQNEHNHEILRRIDLAQRRLEIEMNNMRPEVKSLKARSRRAALSASVDIPEPSAGSTLSNSTSTGMKIRRRAFLPSRTTVVFRAPPAKTAKRRNQPMWRLNSATQNRIGKRLLAAEKTPKTELKLQRLDTQIQRLGSKLRHDGMLTSATMAAETIQTKNIASGSQPPWSGKLLDPDTNECPVKARPMRIRPSLRSMQRQLDQRIAARGALHMKPTRPMRARHSALPYSCSDIRSYHHLTSRLDTIATELNKCLPGAPYAESILAASFSDKPSTAMTGDSNKRWARSADGASSPRFYATYENANPKSSGESQDSTSSYRPSEAKDSDDGASESSTPSSLREKASKLSETTFSDKKARELTYQIPPGDFRAAVMTSKKSNAAFWSYRLYKGDAGKVPSVLYCTNLETAEKQAKLFLNEPILGFDLEWEPGVPIKAGNEKKNVSLIQLASEDKIGLFQIAMFAGETVEKLLPPTLKRILESPDVAKTGVNVGGDARRMDQCLGVKMQGVLELSHLYRVVKFSADDPKKVNFKFVSLADQVQDVLLLPLKKDENRVSAWSRLLNTQQTDYAASDAYAGFRLYHALDTKRRAMTPTPPRPSFQELNQPLVLGDGTKVFKTERKATVPKKESAKVEDEVEDDDEFFDAAEELEKDELVANDGAVDDAAAEALGELQINHAGAVRKSEHSLTAMENPKLASPGDFRWQESGKIVFAPTASADADGASLQSATTVPEDLATDTNSKAAGKVETKRSRPVTPELQLANSWLTSFLAAKSKHEVIARPNELRAYHLWHVQGLQPQDVAATLADPPLSIITVASYIMHAVKVQDFPSDHERTKLVLRILPRNVHLHYARIIQKIGGLA